MRQIECVYQKAWLLVSAVDYYKTKNSRKIAGSKASEIFVNKAAEPRRKRAMPDKAL